MDHWSSGASSLLSCDLSLPALCGMVDTSYMGHYVVVIGFDAAKQEYVIRDPSAGAEELHVCAASFHLARRAFGTDEDLLVISVEGRLQEQQKHQEQQEQEQQQQQQHSLPRAAESRSNSCDESVDGCCGTHVLSAIHSGGIVNHSSSTRSPGQISFLREKLENPELELEETLQPTALQEPVISSPAHVSITINAHPAAVC